MNLSLLPSRGRRLLLAAALGACAWAAAASPAAAQAYPSKPVTVVVPFAAGGTVDKVARQVQQVLQDKLGQSLIIDNRGGAGGTIGMAHVAKSAPDGYTVAMVFDSYATEQHMYPRLPYTHERDLTGVSYMVRSPMVLAVNAASPYQTLADYIAAAKKSGVSFASVGSGSSNHLAAELFHQTAGTSGIHTPYKGGGPAVSDLIGGHVDSIIASLPLVLQHIQSGKLRALAVTAPRRVSALPGVPAIAETFPGFEIYSWVGMVAPAKAPESVLDTLAAATTAALRDPGVAQRMQESGFEVVAGGREEMNRLVRSESVRWGQLIRKLNITAQ
jgi:tripartite-type tricarboxylate transporter receptor subunit TctC